MVDLLVNSCTYYTNFMRPVAGILRSRKGRKFFSVLRAMIPETLHSLIPILYFIILMLVISGVCFDSRIPELADPFITSYNWFWLVFTGDSFDRLLPETVFKDIVYISFFFPAIYIGQKFLLSLIIGDTYETFSTHMKGELQKEKVKEMQGLTKAFSVLDDFKLGYISYNVWRECLQALRPGISPEAVALYYELISARNDSGVSVLNFMSLKYVLDIKLVEESSTNTLPKERRSAITSVYHSVVDHFSNIYEKFSIPVPSRISSMCDGIVKRIDTTNAMTYILLLDVSILALSCSDILLFRGQHFAFASLTPCDIINSLYVLEFVLRLLAAGGVFHKSHDTVNIEAFLFLTGVLGKPLYWLFCSYHGLDSASIITMPYGYLSCPLGKVLLLIRSLRAFRLINVNNDLRNLSGAMYDVLPVLCETMMFTFIIAYMFGLVGYFFFGSYKEWSSPLLAYVEANQLAFMFNFLSSMEAAMEKVHPAAIIFFVVYLILSLIVDNIALSIIIDLHSNVLTMKESLTVDGQISKLDIAFERMVSQARSRVAFTSNGGQLNFKNVSMAKFQSAEVRKYLCGNKDGLITIEDVKQCKPYSTVDLIQIYNDHHRNHQDLNWEVDFIKCVKEAGVYHTQTYESDEVIFSAGEAANTLYLLTNGYVRIYRSDDQSVGMYPTNFLGVECMQPNGKYNYDCIADGAVSCVVFSQDDIAHKLNEDLCGFILRMAFKSNAQVEKEYKDRRKKKNPRIDSLSPNCTPRSKASESPSTDRSHVR